MPALGVRNETCLVSVLIQQGRRQLESDLRPAWEVHCWVYTFIAKKAARDICSIRLGLMDTDITVQR